jgi:hypothetical protein
VNITPAQLAEQYEWALVTWPFVHQVEIDFGLPAFLLFAVGSKETNLANIAGDWSQRAGESSPRDHGFGVWQRDVDAWGIPDGWMDDVEAQCRWSAALLRENIASLGLAEGVRAYNGSGPAARAYRDDVLERMAWLDANYFALPHPNPEEYLMALTQAQQDDLYGTVKAIANTLDRSMDELNPREVGGTVEAISNTLDRIEPVLTLVAELLGGLVKALAPAKT